MEIHRLPVVGITGPYCSGKSTLARELEKLGWINIEVDQLGHTSLKNKKSAVVHAFSRDILDSSGTIDRKKLGSIVFADKDKLSELESILHPEMLRQTATLIEGHQKRARKDIQPLSGILVNAAILYKMKLQGLCDFVLWIRAPKIIRFFRAVERDGLGWKEIAKRFSTQRTLKPQLNARDADIYTVDNLIKGLAVRKIKAIFRVRAWIKTRPT